MKMQRALFYPRVLSLFVLMGCNNPTPAGGTDPEAPQPAVVNAGAEVPVLENRVVVYYFHNTRRCATCTAIEKSINEVLETRFRDDMAKGLLVFEQRDIQDKANESLVKEFKLAFGTMIVATQDNGKTKKWENGAKVWDYAHSPDDLRPYVEKMISAQLAPLRQGN